MKNKNKIVFLGAGIGLMGLILTCSGEIETDDIFKNYKKVSAGYKNVESLRQPLLTLWQVNASRSIN